MAEINDNFTHGKEGHSEEMFPDDSLVPCSVCGNLGELAKDSTEPGEPVRFMHKVRTSNTSYTFKTEHQTKEQ